MPIFQARQQPWQPCSADEHLQPSRFGVHGGGELQQFHLDVIQGETFVVERAVAGDTLSP